MTNAAFDKAIEDWLAGRPNRWETLRGLYYNKKPQRFRLFGFAHSLLHLLIVSSAPALAWFYGSISPSTAVIVGAILFVANWLLKFLSILSTEKASPTVDSQSDLMVRLGDLLTALNGRSKVSDDDRDDAIRACLGIIDVFCRQMTRAKKQEIAVSLVLYSDRDRVKMRIRHRNPGNERPVNREFDASRTIGHQACQRDGKPRVINDIKRFGKLAVVSPTQSDVDYRSIYFIPLETMADEMPLIRGFLSIDSKQPFAFYGNRANAIIVTCEPIVAHIKDLLKENADVSGHPTQNPSRGRRRSIPAGSPEGVEQ